jgi:hypothetical protein
VLAIFAGCQGCARTSTSTSGPNATSIAPSAQTASEAELDRRAAALALRERAVELRERAVADREEKLREAALTPAPLANPLQAKPAPAAQAHTQQEAEIAHRRVENEMEAKGLLPADLPADAARLDDQVYAAMHAGEYDRAVDLAERLGRAVAAVQLDQAFLDSKMRRIAGLRNQKKVAGPTAAEIDGLLQEVTSLAADGQYGTANRRVNRIAALLQ